MKQQPEQLPARAIGVVGASLVAAIAIGVGISWALVRPSPAYLTLPPSTLEHGVFDPHDSTHPLGTPRLDRTAQIESAIDAVVADPSLIGGHR
ncbi:MAG TPA: hypothetical protein VGG74_33355 [Kofleriaceae bacterium]